MAHVTTEKIVIHVHKIALEPINVIIAQLPNTLAQHGLYVEQSVEISEHMSNNTIIIVVVGNRIMRFLLHDIQVFIHHIVHVRP